MTKKVLITTNPLDHEGGVVNYYRLFLKHFQDEEVSLFHMVFGSRMIHFYSPWKKRLLYPLYYGIDLLRFLCVLVADRNVSIVQVSPSLIPVPLIRDTFIILLAKLLRKKVVVYYRGWKENIVSELKKETFSQRAFKYVYRKADVSVVLASHFKDDLIEMGWNPDTILMSTTMYVQDDVLPVKDRSGMSPRFLFLGRISHLKGIGELIEAARELKRRALEFTFIMVGHGDREGIVEEYQEKVKEYGLEGHFRFTGHIAGKEKFQIYADSDVYVFPSWTEGCPTSVLEALGAGLFVISTDVGALRDVIRDGENGKIVHRKDSEDLAEKLVWAVENIEEIRSRRKDISKQAEAKYTVCAVTKQFSAVYQGLLDI
jgi:glycosyltransferase involved in cell wall biosynthesis